MMIMLMLDPVTTVPDWKLGDHDHDGGVYDGDKADGDYDDDIDGGQNHRLDSRLQS